MTAPPGPDERRRVERRANARLADVTLPELRRMLITTTLFVVVLALFVWMVRTVIIAAIVGVVVAVYMRPIYARALPAVRSRGAAALLTLLVLAVPVTAIVVYSYTEIASVASYVDAHSQEIATRIDAALHRVAFLRAASTGDTIQRWVLRASNYGASIPAMVRNALVGLAVAATVFLFTAFYLLVDAESIAAYVRGKLPPRYGGLAAALETNVRGVLYGAIYSTFLTQALKAAVVLVLNVIFGVPLAGVLAIIAFIIGFFPIVGSWSVYLPVAAWLFVFRDAPGAALTMVAVGFLVNTVYISTFLRPKIAAERSRVLNFYWMFVGLVTGVYTFGLVGIVLGPILIGLLKAILDTVTATAAWQLVEEEGDEGPGDASEVMR